MLRALSERAELEVIRNRSIAFFAGNGPYRIFTKKFNSAAPPLRRSFIVLDNTIDQIEYCVTNVSSFAEPA